MSEPAILRINLAPRPKLHNSNLGNLKQKPRIKLTSGSRQNKLQKVIQQGSVWRKFLLSDIREDIGDGGGGVEVGEMSGRKSLGDVTRYYSTKDNQSRSSQPLKSQWKERNSISIQQFPTISEFQCQEHHQSCQSTSYSQVIENYKTNRDQRMKRREERAKTRVSTEVSEGSFLQPQYQSVCCQSKHTEREVEAMRKEISYLRKHISQLSKQRHKGSKYDLDAACLTTRR